VRTQRQRLLTTARLAGAAALGVVAQVAVDMPDGYFGAADRVTAVGGAYSVGLLVLVLIAVVALRRHRRLAGWLAPAIYSLNAAVFVPAVVSDPVVAGAVVVWNLVLVTQFLFPPPPHGARTPRGPAEGLEARLAKEGPALRHLALTSLALTVAVVGYRLSDRLFAEAVCLVLGYGTLAVAGPLLRLLWRSRSPALPAIALPAAAGLAAAVLAGPTVALSLLALAQAVLLATLFARERAAAEVLAGFYHNPPRLIVVSFAALVLIGTVLLTFPAAAAGPRPIAPLDALFTATSAACVTGLIVLDTPTAFSRFGHGVILALIQVGGLGIMVLSTFAALLLGGTLGLRGERALTEVLDLQASSSAYRLTRFIVLATLSIEAAGALGLALCYRAAGFDWPAAAWRGSFHAVSAFCNAGFALQSDSLEMFQSDPAALLLFAALITLGGLGFAVLAAIWMRLRRADPAPASVQVKTVLAVSAALVVAGTAIYAAAEWGRSLDGLPVVDRLVNALFQSVTLRTAGFNSVSFGALAPATALAMIGFMFVGASPGSAGGGIKTTTAAVLLAAIRSTVSRNRSVRLFDREVPGEIVYRSLAIAMTSAAIVGGALFLLLLLEPQPFAELLFEVTSAFGTVGLSLGATPRLGPAGKLIIIAVMFVGRTGPLTLALLLGTGAARAPAVRRPESRVMVG
jgi:trk system potassium uptake protein TrkH